MKIEIGLKSGKHLIFKNVSSGLWKSLIRDYETANFFYMGKYNDIHKGTTMIIRDQIEYIKILKV